MSKATEFVLIGQQGPIIRINPFEIHLSDPEYYENIYSTSQHLDKMKSFEHRFNAPYASFSTTKHDLHRQRRTAISPYFSRRNVSNFASQLQRVVDDLCDRLTEEYRGIHKPLVLDDVYVCLSADTITQFAFGQYHNFIKAPDFQTNFTAAVEGMEDMVHYTTQFPWLLTVCNILPDSVMAFLLPTTSPVLEYQRVGLC